jgi:hypothetical protein
MLKLEFRSFKLTAALLTLLVTTHAIAQTRNPSPFAVPPGQTDSSSDWRPTPANPATNSQKNSERSSERDSERDSQRNRAGASPASSPTPSQPPNTGTTIKVPSAVRAPAIPDSVILSGEDYPTLMSKKRVLKQHNVNQLKVNPVIALGSQKVDFTPIFKNTRALQNIGNQLRALPQHVEVIKEDFSVLEIEEGIVVHNYLNYRIRMGQCDNPTAVAALARTGVRCFTPMTQARKAALLSQPGSSGYIADPAKRAQVLRDYENSLPLAKVENEKQVSKLRKALADPQQRAAYAAKLKLNASQLQSLSNLSDDKLTETVLNSAFIEHEQVLFVPRNPSNMPALDRYGISSKNAPAARQPFVSKATNQSPFALAPVQGDIAASSERGIAAAARATITNPQRDFAEKKRGVPIVEISNVKDNKIPSYIFLTGFTYADRWDWRNGVSINIDYWIDDVTYYIYADAGFGYGFGLRFPIKTDGSYSNSRMSDGTASAKLKLDFVPIDGNAEQYAATGLPSNLLFNGKEFVAEFGAYAGYAFKLPLIGTVNNPQAFKIGFDFTEKLPHPLTNGQFPPPLPGQSTKPANIIFTDLDLLGGYGNYGIVAVQVFPMIATRLFSDGLQFTLVDHVLNTSTMVTQSGREWPIGSDKTAKNSSYIAIKDPVYNLGLELTPGIDARFSVDVAVWSDYWDWPIELPQLKVRIPSGGMNFACHDNTQCSRELQINGLPPVALGRVAPPPIKTLGRVKTDAPPAAQPANICEAAQSAHDRNSPAAPGLEQRCNEYLRTHPELAMLPFAPPVCAAAKSARARNSPAAPGLERQCNDFLNAHPGQKFQ